MVLTSDPSHYTQPRLKHWSIFMKSSQCLLARMLIVSTHRPSLYGPPSLRDDSLRLESDKKVLSESTVVQSIKCATFVILQSLSFVFTARCQNKRKHSKFLLLWGNCLISHLVNKLEDAVQILSEWQNINNWPSAVAVFKPIQLKNCLPSSLTLQSRWM